MENLQNKSRIDWIDVAKGYGILLVIFKHLSIGPNLSIWIGSFHIPLFFFLSGYVFSTKYNFKDFLIRKTKSIIIPYFSLGIPMVLFQIALNYHRGTGSVSSSIELVYKLFVQNRFWTLWYIACLFLLNIIFYGLVKSLKKSKYIFPVSLTFLAIGLTYYKLGGKGLPWNFDICFTAIIFFAVGYYFKNNYASIREHINKCRSIVLFAVFTIIHIVTSAISYKIAGGFGMFSNLYGYPPMSFISAFAGIGSTIIFSHWFTPKAIKFIGQNSLLFFAWHQTIMIPVVRFIIHKFGYNTSFNFTNGTCWSGYLERIVEMIMILSILTICYFIISKTPLRFMIGRYNKPINVEKIHSVN